MSRPNLFKRLFGGAAQPDAAQPEDAIGALAEAIDATAESSESVAAADVVGGEEPAAVLARPDEPQAAQPTERVGWLKRLRRGLARSSSALTGSIAAIFTTRRLDAATIEEFEEALIRADLGVDAAASVSAALAKGRHGRELAEDEVRGILAVEVEKLLQPVARPLVLDFAKRPQVILIVGVNGTGKTTTIGKLAARFAGEGRKVILAAGDTFRAAAIDQLKIWGARTGAPVVAREVGADAAGLAFDALRQAKEEGADVLIIDTAGRLQNRTELMAELEKIVRVIGKQDATAPHHVILTLDATTGQNALNQVEIFAKVAGVTGLVMTKLDGTARGGILVALAGRFGLPVHFIGVGEGVEDLEPFEARDFARAIAGLQ